MMQTQINTALFKKELKSELESILGFWMKFAHDEQNGGFIGQIDFNHNKNYQSEKGAVLNARILWTFAAAYAMEPNVTYKTTAQKAFDYIAKHFYDTESGGIYWSLNADGSPKDTKNQIYALAFVIYGMSEYYRISKDEKALQLAINLYNSIQKHSYDLINKGYFEAFTQDWKPIADLRLSQKDANEKKTMNTHLHIVEAYANLYSVWKNDALQNNIVELLEVIETHFINTETGHLRLFFDENWKEKPDVISYGHDIEAAWLLLQCAEISENEALIERYKNYALLLTDASKEGIDSDGGLWYEFDPKTNQLIKEKHWWPQAELVIGFVNAWQLTHDESYLEIALKNWEFVKKYLLDTEKGEWFWGINADYSIIEKDVAGFWKCPYHNGRATMEILRRLP